MSYDNTNLYSIFIYIHTHAQTHMLITLFAPLSDQPSSISHHNFFAILRFDSILVILGIL